jgi:hypothetical protein
MAKVRDCLRPGTSESWSTRYSGQLGITDVCVWMKCKRRIECFLSCELETIYPVLRQDRSCGERLRMRDLTESIASDKTLLNTCATPSMIRVICEASGCYHEKWSCSRRGGTVSTDQRCWR